MCPPRGLFPLGLDGQVERLAGRLGQPPAEYNRVIPGHLHHRAIGHPDDIPLGALRQYAKLRFVQETRIMLYLAAKNDKAR